MSNDHETSDWRLFEQLVTRIETDARQKGLIVKSPDKIRSLITGDLREVDASIRDADLGTLITIECRRRKSKEDVTWIEQLATKMKAIGATKTVAVSSSGFSKQAYAAAQHYGIDLRLVSELTLDDINPKQKIDFILFHHRRCALHGIGIILFDSKDGRLNYLFKSGSDPSAKIFERTKTREKWSLNDLWLELQKRQDIFKEIEIAKPPKRMTCGMSYPGNVTIASNSEPELLGEVIFFVELSIEVEQVTLGEATKVGYSGNTDSGLQRIEFESKQCLDGEYSISMQFPTDAKSATNTRFRLTTPRTGKGTGTRE